MCIRDSLEISLQQTLQKTFNVLVDESTGSASDHEQHYNPRPLQQTTQVLLRQLRANAAGDVDRLSN
eukprot:6346171-Amphidinium_carterae.1